MRCRGSESAWHGFFGWFAALVAVLAAILLAYTCFGPKMAIPIRLVVFGGFALALLSVILAFFIHPGTGQGGTRSGQIGGCTLTFEAHIGHGFGYWASLIVIAIGAAVAYLQLRDGGEAGPWKHKPKKREIAFRANRLPRPHGREGESTDDRIWSPGRCGPPVATCKDAASAVRHDRRRPWGRHLHSRVFRLVRRERRAGTKGFAIGGAAVVGLSLLASLCGQREVRRCERGAGLRAAGGVGVGGSGRLRHAGEQAAGSGCQAGAHHRPDRHLVQAALFVVSWLQDSGRIGSASTGGTGSTQWGAPQQYGQPTYSGSPSYGLSPVRADRPGAARLRPVRRVLASNSPARQAATASPSTGVPLPPRNRRPAAERYERAVDGLCPARAYAAGQPAQWAIRTVDPAAVSGYPQQPGPGGYGQG